MTLTPLRASALLFVTTSLALSASRARAEEDRLEYPARAIALRPTGMILHRSAWYSQVIHGPAGNPLAAFHHVEQELEARLPIDSLLIGVVFGGRLAWYPLDAEWSRTDDDYIAAHIHAPELDAAFHDAPAPAFVTSSEPLRPSR